VPQSSILKFHVLSHASSPERDSYASEFIPEHGRLIACSIQWIGENIEYFGGDPDKVSIFGQSAGGKIPPYYLTSYVWDLISNSHKRSTPSDSFR
jgi:hypothetical protein